MSNNSFVSNRVPMVCLVLRESLETMVLRVILVLQDLQEQLVPPDLRCDHLLR